jgi:hypothetical protein
MINENDPADSKIHTIARRISNDVMWDFRFLLREETWPDAARRIYDIARNAHEEEAKRSHDQEGAGQAGE